LPEWADHLRPRLASLRLSPAREDEIVQELSQHLEDRWRELVAGGASEDEAARLALAEFREGNLLAQYLAPLQQAQTPAPLTSGATIGHVLRDVWVDLRYAARRWRRQPAFTLAVVLTLTIGIGANTATFAVLNSVLLEPLPYPAAGDLVVVWNRAPGAPGIANVSGGLRLSPSMYMTYADCLSGCRTPSSGFTGKGTRPGDLRLYSASEEAMTAPLRAPAPVTSVT
jgi:hypothetical protein